MGEDLGGAYDLRPGSHLTLDDERPDRGDSEADDGVRLSVRLFAPGTEIGRRYEVRGVLGTGDSAVVYEAYDRELKRPVALKVLRTDRTSEAALERFRREVAIARDAASPPPVRGFHHGQAGGTVFLAEELPGGGAPGGQTPDASNGTSTNPGSNNSGQGN